MAILAGVQTGDVSLLGSEALDYEVGRIPNDARRAEVMGILAQADEYLEISEGVIMLAESLENGGIFPMDAVHLALASTANADFFCTCDNKLLRKGPLIPEVECNVVSILDLAVEILQ